MRTREESLKWWQNLSETTKKFLMEKHLPYQKFITNGDIEYIFKYYLAVKEAIR